MANESSANLRFQLLKWQLDEMKKGIRFAVVMAGRRCGKTYYAAIRLLIAGCNCPDKLARVMYIAPTQAMATDLMWDLLLSIGVDVIASRNISDNNIVLINGVTIQIRGADKPDRLRGKKLFFAVLDEMKDMKDDVWELNVRPSLSDMQGGALIIGTPEPGDNQFNKLFDYAETGENPEWSARLLTTYDNETIDRDEIAEAKRTLSTAAFEQEYLANRYTTGANLLKMEWFAHSDEPKVGDYYIAIDPAGYEAVADGRKKKHLDNFAIAVVKVNDRGEWWTHKIEYGRWDVREASLRVLMAIRTFRPIAVGIEQGSLARALMPYLNDLMRKNSVYAHIQMIPTSGSSKANRIIYALQGMMEHGRITFNQRENWDQFRREMIAFPTSKAHDDCFPADAPIITRDGIKPICEVTTDDYVLTRNGFRRVLKAWCKGVRPVITRLGITATPEHRVFTKNRGWVRLGFLSATDILIAAQSADVSSWEMLPIMANTNGCASLQVVDADVLVYDLMVETDPEFFAYGVLVHNCLDALSMIAYLVRISYGVGIAHENEEREVYDAICGF